MENTSAPRRTGSCWQSVILQVTDNFQSFPLSSHVESPPFDLEPLVRLHHLAVILHQVRTSGSLWNWSTGPCWSWGGRTDSSATTGTPTHWMPADQFMTFLACSSATAPTTLKVRSRALTTDWCNLCSSETNLSLLSQWQTSHKKHRGSVSDLVHVTLHILQVSTAGSGTWTVLGWCARTARCLRTSLWNCMNTDGSPSVPVTGNTCVETREAR